LYSFGLKAYKAVHGTDILRARLFVFKMKKRALAVPQAATGIRFFIAELVISYLVFIGTTYQENLTPHIHTPATQPATNPPIIILDVHDLADKIPKLPRPLRRGTVRVDLTRLARRVNL
jgi:hypothetical protein